MVVVELPCIYVSMCLLSSRELLPSSQLHSNSNFECLEMLNSALLFPSGILEAQKS